ncbi:MAG: hypothetical protein ACYC8W_11345 [Candidatus Tyrphobacter sp.]
MQTAPLTPRRTLEFGIYRDGDNNLDAIQESVVAQAIDVSRRDPRIAFAVEDTSAIATGRLATHDFDLAGGTVTHDRVRDAKEMSDPKTLAAFVARTLDEAEACGAQSTWIDLVDHGGGDGGGLQTSDGRIMPMPKIASAIAQGVALHARAHPEDAERRVDGVVANQCLMASLGFENALSRAGVHYLAASPETMVAPGVPTGVAEAIASHASDPQTMARAIVARVMQTQYDAGPFGTFGPAAAFDVIDCDARATHAAGVAIKRLNDALVARAHDPAARAAMREDISSVDGMTRIPGREDLPWRADRPALAVYDRLANDARLDASVRADAKTAAGNVRDLVLAHGESRAFAPFGGADYRDAVGPTVHLPTARREIDPWAPRMSETNNAFYRSVDGRALTRALA